MPSADHLILVLNAGSSSLKYQAVRPSGDVAGRGLVERVDETGFDRAIRAMEDELAAGGVAPEQVTAVGHRVVHGGTDHTSPTVVDEALLDDIDRLSVLAPLHNPAALAVIAEARRVWSGVPHVAVFDTGFFADLPAVAATYALDSEVAERAGIRRFGMHGISHQYVAGEVARFLDRPLADLDQIVLHLGNGASASALRGGRPVETSMGFTPLEGLVMGTRAGDVDPGVLLHLLEHDYTDLAGLTEMLQHRSGLQGLAGRHDFRDLTAAVEAGDARARLAYDVYCHRLRKYVGAYLAVLGGADVLTFTAGIGEHVARLRADALAGLEPLGIEVDPARNDAEATGPRRISSDSSAVTVLVVPTDEELAIAGKVAALLG